MSKNQVQAEEQAQVKEFKTVAICGTAETLGNAPFNDPDIKIWSVATAVTHAPFKRADRLFEMHTKDRWVKRIGEINGFLDKNPNCEIYMQKHFDEIPKSKEFPLSELDKCFRRYYTNSVSYMIALAIVEGYGNIQLWGVHMATDSEYEYERPSVEYYLAIAEAAGVSVFIPAGVEILKAKRLYGYENSETGTVIRKRLADMEKRMTQAREQLENAKDIVNQYQGAIEFAKYVKKMLI